VLTSQLPPVGMSPLRSRSMAARMRVSFLARWWALMRTSVVLAGRGGAGVDLGEDTSGAVVIGLQAGLFGLAGGAEADQERLGGGGPVGPDGAVAGVVGGLGAAGRVAHAGQWLVGVGCAGQFEAQRPRGGAEPAAGRRP